MNNVIDLDILKPEKKIIKFNGNEIDVSFIPLAITFEIDELCNKLVSISKSGDVVSDITVQKDLFNCALDIVTTFCSYKYPEMDKKWFMENATALQIGTFTEAIRGAISKSVQAAAEKTKN